ncbi:hypothetical protein C8D77_104539 [Mesorhizobium loti]|uniref:Uncharacterized protein n=1 Tax=Rhizobium loti TaxID=381 RepID=A0A8E3B4W4_RHILI|nr:hypothetical protein C8D77_104539 [Mesorhizobium loti]
MLLRHGSDFCIVCTPIYAVPASPPSGGRCATSRVQSHLGDPDNKVRALNRVHPIHKTGSVE